MKLPELIMSLLNYILLPFLNEHFIFSFKISFHLASINFFLSIIIVIIAEVKI